MKTEELKAIREITNADEVNKMIADGWCIVKIFHQYDEDKSSRPLYIVGKVKI